MPPVYWATRTNSARAMRPFLDGDAHVFEGDPVRVPHPKSESRHGFPKLNASGYASTISGTTRPGVALRPASGRRELDVEKKPRPRLWRPDAADDRAAPAMPAAMDILEDEAPAVFREQASACRASRARDRPGAGRMATRCGRVSHPARECSPPCRHPRRPGNAGNIRPVRPIIMHGQRRGRDRRSRHFG